MKKGKSCNTILLDTLKILKSEGVDVTKIKQTRMVNKKQVYTRLIDIKQDGIDIESIIQKHGLNPDYKIGFAILELRQSYKGNKKYSITEAEKKDAETLDVVHKKTVLTGLFKILEILEKEGINVGKIPQKIKVDGNVRKTVLSDVVPNDIILKYQLDPDYKIGSRLEGMIGTCNGCNTYAITENQKRYAERFGFADRKSSISETLDVLDILYDEGININKIKKHKTIKGKAESTTLMDISQKDVDMEKVIKKYGLDPNYPIGRKLGDLQYVLTGKGKIIITNGDILRAKLLGIEPRKTSVARTISVLETLYSEGVNIPAIKQAKKHGNKLVSTTLEDIDQHGINIYAIIEKHKLDADFKIGAGITKLRQAYSGKSANPITDDEKRRAEKIGAVKMADMEAEQKRLQEKLEKAEALKQEAEMQAGKVK